MHFRIFIWVYLFIFLLGQEQSVAQTAPSRSEEAAYSGLPAAASYGDVERVRQLLATGADIEARDTYGRTPLHIAAFKSHDVVVETLAKAGADVNALENDAYDIITIAAVANDLDIMNLAIALGANPKNITSPYEGTALIAAAHLGHVEIVQALIDSGAPLDHINNLGWTALIEAVVLGDGGPRHIEIVSALVVAGADISISDRDGMTPLDLAKRRKFKNIIVILER